MEVWKNGSMEVIKKNNPLCIKPEVVFLMATIQKTPGPFGF